MHAPSTLFASNRAIIEEAVHCLLPNAQNLLDSTVFATAAVLSRQKFSCLAMQRPHSNQILSCATAGITSRLMLVSDEKRHEDV